MACSFCALIILHGVIFITQGNLFGDIKENDTRLFEDLTCSSQYNLSYMNLNPGLTFALSAMEKLVQENLVHDSEPQANNDLSYNDNLYLVFGEKQPKQKRDKDHSTLNHLNNKSLKSLLWVFTSEPQIYVTTKLIKINNCIHYDFGPENIDEHNGNEVGNRFKGENDMKNQHDKFSDSSPASHNVVTSPPEPSSDITENRGPVEFTTPTMEVTTESNQIDIEISSETPIAKGPDEFTTPTMGVTTESNQIDIEISSETPIAKGPDEFTTPTIEVNTESNQNDIKMTSEMPIAILLFIILLFIIFIYLLRTCIIAAWRMSCGQKPPQSGPHGTENAREHAADRGDDGEEMSLTLISEV